ncbi:hypothetical protein BG015_005057 [Linnemannia schmuckeri]|uniref:Uncharacterized protein n=1 Tax=Linnemannia schmuckeri TaxID=64567 RepID=A0A9P5S1L9_9FUNG|nr:hypothetical protein BG015_005057 [Linnemannia schmuckeri]
MAKLSEMDMAVAGVMRMVDEALEDIPVKEGKVLFAVGNGTLKSGLNLTSNMARIQGCISGRVSDIHGMPYLCLQGQADPTRQAIYEISATA